MTLSDEATKPQLEESTTQLNPASFADSFWGDKHNGYAVLLQNLRNSQSSVKEFELFLRECTSSEDHYVKQLVKITAQIQKFLADTSLAPVWHQVLKELNEKNSWAHLHFMHRIHELIKEVQSYYEDFRRQKKKIRESEQQTHQIVENFKALKAQLTKQKEQFHQISSDMRKQSQLLNYNENHSPSSTPVQQLTLHIQKLEKRSLQTQEEYKHAIDKYNAARLEYERKFTESCHTFQAQEEQHLKQMRSFIMTYTQLLAQLNSSRQKNFNDCQQKLNNVFTSESLLEQFILTKSTGTQRPAEVEFINPFLTNRSLSTMNSSNSELNLTAMTQLNRRRSINTDTSPEPSMLTPRSERGDANEQSKSSLNRMISSTSRIEELEANKSTKPKSGFSLFSIYSNRLKSRSAKEYNAFTATSKKAAGKQKSPPASGSVVAEDGAESFELQQQDGFSLVVKKQQLQAAMASEQIAKNVFDKQLMQIDELEDRIQSSKFSKEDEVSFRGTTGEHQVKSEPLNDSFDTKALDINNQSFASSVFNESSMFSDMITSMTSHSMIEAIPIKRPATITPENSNKFGVGSLVTATSLEDNMLVSSSELSDEKRMALDYLDQSNQAQESFFAEFDDITFESINQMNIIREKKKEKDNTDMTNYYFDSEAMENKNTSKSLQHSPVVDILINDKLVTTSNSTDVDVSSSSNNNPTTVSQEIELDDELSNNNNDSDSDSDSDSTDSDTPKKVVLKIKPIDEVDRSLAASPDVLQQISKNLQLKLNNNAGNYSSGQPRSHRKYYGAVYSRNEYGTVQKITPNSNMSKSMVDQSLSSLSSSFNINSQEPISKSPSLHQPSPLWYETRSASVLGIQFNTKQGHPQLDENGNLIESSKPDLYHETSSTMFTDMKSSSSISSRIVKGPFNGDKAPPLPPLPKTIQQKYQQRLLEQYTMKPGVGNNSSALYASSQVKSQPITIKSASKSSSQSNNDEDTSFGEDEEDDAASMKSCVDSIDSATFSKSLKLSGDEHMKF